LAICSDLEEFSDYGGYSAASLRPFQGWQIAQSTPSLQSTQITEIHCFLRSFSAVFSAGPENVSHLWGLEFIRIIPRRCPPGTSRGRDSPTPQKEHGMASTKVAETPTRPERRQTIRRQRIERRQNILEHEGEERRLGDRRKVERRRQIDPTTCERDYQPDEIEFMKAMDDYKRRSGRQFPTWSEVLEVIRDLGYRKVAPPSRTYEAIAQS